MNSTFTSKKMMYNWNYPSIYCMYMCIGILFLQHYDGCLLITIFFFFFFFSPPFFLELKVDMNLLLFLQAVRGNSIVLLEALDRVSWDLLHHFFFFFLTGCMKMWLTFSMTEGVVLTFILNVLQEFLWNKFLCVNSSFIEFFFYSV